MNNFDVAQEKTKSSSVQCNIRLNIPLSAAACKGFDPFIEIAVRLKKIVHSLPLGIGMCLITKAVLIEEDYLKEIELTFLPNTAQVDTTDDERRLGQCFKMLFDS